MRKNLLLIEINECDFDFFYMDQKNINILQLKIIFLTKLN